MSDETKIPTEVGFYRVRQRSLDGWFPWGVLGVYKETYYEASVLFVEMSHGIPDKSVTSPHFQWGDRVIMPDEEQESATDE